MTFELYALPKEVFYIHRRVTSRGEKSRRNCPAHKTMYSVFSIFCETITKERKSSDWSKSGMPVYTVNKRITINMNVF